MKKKAQPACRYLQKNSRIALSWNRPRNPEAAVLNLSRHIVQANRAQTVQNRHKMRANASKCQQIVVSKKPKLLWRSDLGLSTLEVAKYFCETVKLYDLDHQNAQLMTGTRCPSPLVHPVVHRLEIGRASA